MLKADTENRVALLTIDRAERRNAIGAELVHRLRDEIRRCDNDPAIGAVVLTGTAPGFSAGSDLKELATLDLAGMCRHEADTAALAREIGLAGKPVVAAVDGFALGGGFILAAACDVVVTGPAVRWHLPEVTIGWIPPWGLEILTARVGPVAGRRLTWGVQPIDGHEAYRLGVADVMADRPVEKAIALAEGFAGLPAPAVAATKHYFALSTAPLAEPRDMIANRMFSENCRHEVARATLKKFGVKA